MPYFWTHEYEMKCSKKKRSSGAYFFETEEGTVSPKTGCKCSSIGFRYLGEVRYSRYSNAIMKNGD